jgi:drug/metabolite transporter (DMT)-like permease
VALWNHCWHICHGQQSENGESFARFFVFFFFFFFFSLKFAMLHLDTGTFILLNNLSIPMAAILFRIFMKRQLTTYQYCALVVLVTGLVTSKLFTIMGSHHPVLFHNATEISSSSAATDSGNSFAVGVVVMLIAACAAAAGDVGAEFAFKMWAHKQHFVAQSIML